MTFNVTMNESELKNFLAYLQNQGKTTALKIKAEKLCEHVKSIILDDPSKFDDILTEFETELLSEDVCEVVGLL